MKIRIHWVGVEHSTNILVKKVPDGVSHEDDLEVGVVPLGSRLVLHLKQDAQCVLHRHLKCRWICSPSCSLRGWWDGTPRCTAAAALSAATETCQKKTQLDGAFLGKRSMIWKNLFCWCIGGRWSSIASCSTWVQKPLNNLSKIWKSPYREHPTRSTEARQSTLIPLCRPSRILQLFESPNHPLRPRPILTQQLLFNNGIRNRDACSTADITDRHSSSSSLEVV